MICLKEGSGRLNVCLSGEQIGDDWLILLTGGERPHLGASAIAWNHAGSVETRVLTVPGHREDELARACAETCCGVLGSAVQVSCGIHIDHADEREIRQLVEMAQQLTKRFLCRVCSNGLAHMENDS